MYGLKKEVFNDIINVIKKYENIECVYLFGSRARDGSLSKQCVKTCLISPLYATNDESAFSSANTQN